MKIMPEPLVNRAQLATESIATDDVGAPESEVSRIGQAMHRLLQWGPTADPQASQAAVAREFGLTQAQNAVARRMADRILRGEGAWAWDPAHVTWAGDEVELYFEGALLRLDRLVRRHAGGTDHGQWWVLDHKSTSQPQQDAALVAQLALYRRAVQALHRGVVRAAFLTSEGKLIELGEANV